MRKEMNNKKVKKLGTCLLAMTSFFISMNSVYATAGDPLTVINNLSDFIFSLIRALGVIMVAFGSVQVGMSFKSHDPSQKSSGILSIAGGILIVFTEWIVKTLLGL